MDTPSIPDESQVIWWRNEEVWGPFLERPGNLTGPKSQFVIKVLRKVGHVLTFNEVGSIFVAVEPNPI